jgi:uncharacterized membrane protein YdjX (TVP38/TMEM64 family)
MYSVTLVRMTNRHIEIWHWTLLCAVILALILVPFFVFGDDVELWTRQVLQAATGRPLRTAVVLGGLLATDIVLPVPSSLVSTACGFFLGVVSGTLTSWAGMNASCLMGFAITMWLGRPLAARLLQPREMEQLERMSHRYGAWALVLARPVPVLAEASVLFAGLGRVRPRQFLVLTTLSNGGISVTYALIGALSADINAFLVAMAGAIAVPWLFLSIAKYWHRPPATGRAVREGRP